MRVCIFKLEHCYSLQISGSKASSWLGLDSDSDGSHEQQDDNDDDKSDHLVTVKPHFEGKAGEEVFVVLFTQFVATWNLQPCVSRELRYHRYITRD